MGLLAIALATLLALGAQAGEDPGVTAAPVLQIPLGSRALGMGGAFTAVASDASTLYYNPAGLSRLSAHELAFTFISGLSDNSLQHAAYGGPIPFAGIFGNGYASAGASLLFSQKGTIEVNKTNPDGSFLSSENLSAGSDLVLSAGYSERAGSTPLEIKEASYGINHFLGVSGKFIRSTLVEQFSATALTADLGYLANSPEAGLSFGLSGLNIGGKMKFIDEADPLPTTLRSGLAYQVRAPSAHSLTLAADCERLIHERQWRVNAGLESFWLKSYGFRIGYQFLQDTLGLTMGLGLRWRSRFLFDYAWSMGRALNDSHRFTVSYRFGGATPVPRGGRGRPMIESRPEREEPQGVEEKAPPQAPPPRPSREERPGIPNWIY